MKSSIIVEKLEKQVNENGSVDLFYASQKATAGYWFF